MRVKNYEKKKASGPKKNGQLFFVHFLFSLDKFFFLTEKIMEKKRFRR